MSDETFTQGDTAPPIVGSLKQGDGTPFDLTNVDSVRFQMRKSDDRRYTVDAEATITDRSGGVVEYVWRSNDLDVPGEYVSQWEIHHNDGKIQTTNPPNTITVRRQ